MPNVNVDEFSSLLTFMYTGYLDLNAANIYSILLATHILHMPRALELCRGFLLENQPGPPVIKPIPSRKTAPAHQPVFAPLFSHLHKSEATPFRAVERTEQSDQSSDLDPGPSTSRGVSGNSLSKPDLVGVSDKKVEKVEKAEKLERLKSSAGKKKEASGSTSSGSNSNKVIVDIACCDGPVRFHRVINKNYGRTEGVSVSSYELPRQTSRTSIEALNKVMTENMRDKKIIDENQASLTPNPQSTTNANANANANELFTCLYCNHTFKSQYCYQKHARRHLNPVSLEGTKAAPKAESSSKREVKLLDMNVQYYPCKSCGSKFPSYYFVHKHRKLCHPEEMADSGNKNNEMVVVQQDADLGENSENSAVDVENDASGDVRNY